MTKRTYGSIHDNAYFFHCSVPLIEVNLPFVLNIEKLEHFLEELGLVYIIGVLLHDFGPQLILKTKIGVKISEALTLSFIFLTYLIS